VRDRLKILISETGLSQKEFAERINISSSAITQFIKGQSKGLNSDTIQSIISVYNINPTWLLTGEGEMFSSPPDAKDGKISYTAITDISEITRTRWFKNLTKEQREIITHLASVKDRGILKKVSDIMSRQSAKEKGDRELEELDRELKRK